jgi:serine protease inhibitor
MRTLLMGFVAVVLFATSCTKTPAINDESDIFRQKLLDANNAFSIDLLQQTHQENDSANLVLSPLSLTVGLSVLANGAEGATREAILTALEMQGLSLTDVNQTYKAIMAELPNSDPSVELSIANSIWLRNGIPVKTIFEQINQLYYQVSLQQIDFTSPTAIETINNWVNNATGGNIQDIIDQLMDGQGIYIVNSLWFNARFKQAFDSTLTTQQPFYVGYSQAVPVDMMSGRGMRYGYFADNEVKIADLPYENGTFSFTIIMPSDLSNIDQLIDNLSVSRWNTWMNGLSYDVSPTLFLPKFQIDYNSFLKPLLVNLGMGIAFEDGSDFSNMTDAVLSISNLKHKTSISVSEAGVIATEPNSVSSSTFSVNKPFIIAVREKESGRMLMIGKVMNPSL